MKTIGIDLYNQTVTGEMAKTLNAIRSDSDHVPCVIYESMDMQRGDDNKMGRKLHLARQVPDN